MITLFKQGDAVIHDTRGLVYVEKANGTICHVRDRTDKLHLVSSSKLQKL